MKVSTRPPGSRGPIADLLWLLLVLAAFWFMLEHPPHPSEGHWPPPPQEGRE